MPRLQTKLLLMIGVVFFVLDAVQPVKSAHLYLPLGGRTYITIGNRSGFWVFRVGRMGGVDGFEAELTNTNQQVRQLRSKFMPFPLTWYHDWGFHVGVSSPYFLWCTPAYFPALVMTGLLRSSCRRGRTQSQTLDPADE